MTQYATLGLRPIWAKIRPRNLTIQGLNLGSDKEAYFPWCGNNHTFCPDLSQAGNNHHPVAKTRSDPGKVKTGDDRNACDLDVVGSNYISAMESKGSVVRAILTVSILILARAPWTFKVGSDPVQRKGISDQEPARSVEESASR
jgi:hypothetical protein